MSGRWSTHLRTWSSVILEAMAYVIELKTQSPPRTEKNGDAIMALVGKVCSKYPTITAHVNKMMRGTILRHRMDRRPYLSARKPSGIVMMKSGQVSVEERMPCQ